MFGIDTSDIINNTPDILKGTYREITNKENELYNFRIKICKDCPLYTEKSTLGEICDHKKCFDIENQEITYGPGRDIICGCGCRLKAKARLQNAKCVLGKW